jgi:hypothetical protein
LNMAFFDEPFVYPQAAATPSATNSLLEESASVEVVEKEASSSQRVVATGTAIPIVFGKFADGAGGVWVSPPAARVGLKFRDTGNSEFAFGLVVSDGEIGAIEEADIYKGSFNISNLDNGSFTNAYGFLPTAGYDYTISETTTDPGTPGTDDQYEEREQTVTINQQNYTSIQTQNFVSVISRSSDHAINVTITVTKGSDGSTIPYAWRIKANNIVVTSGTATGSASTSYDAGRSVSWLVELKAIDSNQTGSVKCVMTGTGIRRYTTVIPGDPAIPPVYTTGGLPLFPGAGGNFIGLSCLAVKAIYQEDESEQDIKEQIRCFVRNGILVKNVATNAIESSSNFIDLAYYLLKANQVSDELIDLQGFRNARNFLEVNGFRFNGVLASSTNLRNYFSAVAPAMMLQFVQDAGRFSFKPVLPLDSNGEFDGGSIFPAKVFTNQNIIEGSYSKSYYKTQVRKPFCALLSWREQQRQAYSIVVATEFRYNNTAIDGPFENYDYSDFITDINHASIVGNYILSSRARITHSISFSTYLDGSVADGKLAGELEVMDIIRVKATNDTDLDSDEFYQINSVTEGANGQLNIEAVHFPSDSTGASLIAADVLASVPPLVPNPQPDGTDGGGTPTPTPTPTEGIGILSVSPTGVMYAEGMVITLTASYDGTANDVTFNWFGPSGSSAPVATTTGPVLTWTAAGAGDAGGYTVIAVSPTASDSGKRATAGLDYQPFFRMSGGTVTTDGDFRIHTFKFAGTINIDFAPPVGTFEYLICGPGGSAENNFEYGGAGGGGVLAGNITRSVGSYSVTVGVTPEYNAPRSAANQSSLFGFTALCGGDNIGEPQSGVYFNANGGCGGGAHPQTGTVAGIGSQGGDGARGGDQGFFLWGGGGGGASGANGTSGSLSQAGRGGEGLLSSISGSPYVYGSGGGGCMDGDDTSLSAAPGGTGAGKGALVNYVGSTRTFVNATLPTNFGAGASAGYRPRVTGDPVVNYGIQGIVIVRYQYR